jgi:hypothetical protein
MRIKAVSPPHAEDLTACDEPEEKPIYAQD